MKKRVEAGPFTTRLMVRGEALANHGVAKTVARLAGRLQPDGVTAEALPDGVRLSGRGLKLRIVRDPSIGRFDQ